MSDVKPDTFGKNLKRIRHSRGFTQGDVARRSGGLSQSSVTQIENGLKDPTLGTILKLAIALNVPASKLVDLDYKTTVDISGFEAAESYDEVDPLELKKVHVLLRHLKRLKIIE